MMKCAICGNDIINPPYSGDEDLALICLDCTKALLQHDIVQGMVFWDQSIAMDARYHQGAKQYVEGLIKATTATGDLPCVAQEIRDSLLYHIKLHLQFYSHDDLVALCLLIKQRFRAGMEGACSDFWDASREFNVACTMIRCCYEIEEYEDNALTVRDKDDAVNLISAIVLLRILLVLESNIDICKNIGYAHRTIEELLYQPIEWEEMEKHFAEYVALAQSEKPEDYRIQSKALKVKLCSEHKDLKSITKQAGDVIKQYFGFDLEVMEHIAMYPLQEAATAMEEDQNIFYSLIPLSEIYKRHEEIADRETVDKVIDIFTLRKAPEALPDPLIKGYYELRSIVRFGDHAFLVPYDLFQNAAAFRSYAMSGHFIDLYSMDDGMQKKLSAVLNNMSTFIVYTLVDVLQQNGYTLPQEKKRIDGVLYTIPIAEIKKVKKGGVNLLNQDEDMGDIDILACDENSKTVYNIEVKHYKPAITVRQMLADDRNKVEGKDIVRKTLARETLINNEQETFLRLLGVPVQSGYKVKSLIVSSRPNYFAQLSVNLECITWRQFCERAENRSL